ncbi:hypothetical protein IJ818_01575 [bacterium]|nr:hypothetical protein [bacterium]
MNTNLFSSICNIISLIASIITIGAMICSLFSLSELNKFKKDLYRRENCHILVKKLSKILNSTKKEINLNGRTNRNIVETVNYLETLIKGNSFLIENSKIHLNIIKNIKIIDKSNIDNYIDSVKAIIQLFEQGE